MLSLGGLTENAWSLISQLPDSPKGTQALVRSEAFQGLVLDHAQLQSSLSNAPLEFTSAAKNSPLEFVLPTPDGTFERFEVVESPIMAAPLAAKFPSIKTYSGQGIDDPAATLRFDVTPAGLHAQVLSPSGSYYVDPYFHLDTSAYASYYRRDLLPASRDTIYHEHDHETELALLEDELITESNSANVVAQAMPNGDVLRTFRLAVAATGEYVQYHGGTVEAGQAAIVTAINRVTGIYENELAIRLELVANNDSLVFTNPASDPYSNFDGSAMLDENQPIVDSIIGDANYDIGHVFSTGGGGIATLGSVGVSGTKARGVTGLPDPDDDKFYVDFVAHEMGHQFGANHTWNGVDGSCGPGEYNSATAFEPGSGTTIMGYAGICGADDIQQNSDPYFHSVSFQEIIDHVTIGPGNVATETPNGNTVPTVDAGQDYVIPAGTPFALTAVGSDDDGDTVTYGWEQSDRGPQSPVDAPDDGQGPLFRSFLPTTDPTRTFPQLPDILSNTQTLGEQLPTTNRDLNFRVTIRDNKSGGGGVNSDDMLITVVDTGSPFQVTSPNTNVTWGTGTTQTVTWDVAGTDGGAINAANVNILLSTDGGLTFTEVLASDTPNDGSQDITVPLVASTMTRLKVEAADNIFFDISDADFTVEITGSDPVAIDDIVTTNEDTPIDIAILANDSDPDSTLIPSSVVFVTSPTNGVALLNPATGVVNYSPNLDFVGMDSFQYTVASADGGLSNVATVSITVLNVNDGPTAVDDTFVTAEDTQVTVSPTDNDFDSDGSIVPSSLAIVSGPTNGSVSVNSTNGRVTYTPRPNFFGLDSLTYTVADDGGAVSNVATVTITVTSVNDPPIAQDDVAATGVSVPTLIDVLSNDFDIDGAPGTLSVQIIQPPLHGTTLVDFGTQRVMYSPDPGFAGADIFTYRVVDNEGAFSNVARVTLRVGDPVSFSGAVFADRNNNGAYEGDELGIPGVTITFAKIDGPVTFSVSVQTGLDGSFSLFEVPGSGFILPAGVYSITEQHPTPFLDGIDTLGSAGGVLLNDLFQSITLGSGQAATGYLFGERGLNAAFLAENPQLRRFFASTEPGDLEDFVDLLFVSPGDAVGAVNRAGFSLRTSNTVTPAGLPSFNFGLPQWHPISGDWNGDGIDSIGAYNSETATFFLSDSNHDGVANHPAFNYGLPGWIPLAGDWNGDGVDTIGVYNPATATFFLRNRNTTGVADVPAFNYGIPNWVPLAGDWEGLGIDTIGVYNPTTATYFLRFTNDSGPADVAPFNYGMPGWRPLMGDWNDDGVDTAGVHNPATSTFFLRNSNTSGVGEVVFNHGNPGSVALAGHWMPMTGQPLLFDGEAGPVTASDVRITTEDIMPLLAEAAGRWSAAGVDPVGISQLLDVDIRFTDLPGRQLGLTARDRIYLDYNAAGQGWFVDPTPSDDEEFVIQTAEGFLFASEQPAVERIDLLSVITHELGHLLGFGDHDDDPADLMYESLAAGRRKLPTTAADDITPP